MLTSPSPRAHLLRGEDERKEEALLKYAGVSPPPRIQCRAMHIACLSSSTSSFITVTFTHECPFLFFPMPGVKHFPYIHFQLFCLYVCKRTCQADEQQPSIEHGGRSITRWVASRAWCWQEWQRSCNNRLAVSQSGYVHCCRWHEVCALLQMAWYVHCCRW